MGKTVCCHQINFFPYIGVFEKFRCADSIIFIDDDQFNRWANRNMIKVMMNSQEKWLTIPVMKNSSFLPINEVKVSENINWKEKHFSILRENYFKAPHYEKYISMIRKIYAIQTVKLLDYTLPSNFDVMEIFGINKEIHFSSKLLTNRPKSPSKYLYDLVKCVGGDRYLSGRSGRRYLNLAEFPDIQIVFQDYKSIKYNQLGGLFRENLSIIDYIFNQGNETWW